MRDFYLSLSGMYEDAGKFALEMAATYAPARTG
jgi:hypothetical protein